MRVSAKATDGSLTSWENYSSQPTARGCGSRFEAVQLYADHKHITTTFQHYAPPTREQVAEVDLPFQELLINSDNRFLPQSLPENLLNPKTYELDLEITPAWWSMDTVPQPKIPVPTTSTPTKCYCSCPSTGKLPLYERQYAGEAAHRRSFDWAIGSRGGQINC